MNLPDPARDYSFRKEFGERFVAKRILVTGATGFTGLNLCQALDSLGADVVGAALPETVARASRPERILPLDLTVQGSAQRMIEAADPEIVFHLAGLVDTRQSLDLVVPTLAHNLLGSVHLMSALIGSRCRCVALVTSSETPRPGRSPNSPYAASKQAMVGYAELHRALYGLPVVTARPQMIYGPHQPADKLIPYLIRCCIEHTPPRLSSGKRLCDPVYVKDFIRALLLMTETTRALGQSLDVGTGTGVTIAEVAALVIRLMGADLTPVFGALPDRVGDESEAADIQPTVAALNWRPFWSLEAGLSETIDWFREQEDNIPDRTQLASREVLE